MVILPLQRKMEEMKTLTDEREEFEKFRDQLRARARETTQVDKTTLRFKNMEHEHRFIVGNAVGICKHMRALCAFLVVYASYAAMISRPTETHAFQMNPALMNWNRGAAGLLYNCAWLTIVVLGGLMLWLSTRHEFITSHLLEHYIMSWLFLVLFISTMFFHRWNVVHLFDQNIGPNGVTYMFRSFNYDDDFCACIIGTVLYLSMHTPLRFVVLMPFGVAAPLMYYISTKLCGSPEGQMREDYHRAYSNDPAVKSGCVPGRETSDLCPHDSEGVALGNCLVLSGVVFLALWGKYIMEKQTRANFLTMYQSFEMIKDLAGDEEQDSADKCGTALGKVREALNAANKVLERLAATPAVHQAGLGNDMELVQGHVDYAKRTLQRTDKLFEVNAKDALGKQFEGREDLAAFINANMGGDEVHVEEHAPVKAAVNRADTGPVVQVVNSVKVVKADVLAAGIGTDWNFNALDLARETRDMACVYAGEQAIVSTSYGDTLNVSKEVRRAWVRAIHVRYLPNAYHNEAHGATVCHMSWWFAKQIGLIDKVTQLQVCALLVAALAHDVGHIGRTNLYCNKALHAFGMIWNEAAPLENMHAATAFSVMRDDANIMGSLTPGERTSWRKDIVRLILATDLKEHHSSLAKLKAQMENEDFGQDNRDGSDALKEKFELEMSMEADTIIKSSDIGQGMVPWDPHREWSYRVLAEFFAQGDEEKVLGLPVSPLCERKGYNIVGNQGFFIDCLCRELFTFLGRMCKPDSPGKAALDECLALADKNKELWKEEQPNFNSDTVSNQYCLDRFGSAGSLNKETCYPYEWEKDNVPKERVPTAQNLMEICRFRESSRDHDEAQDAKNLY